MLWDLWGVAKKIDTTTTITTSSYIKDGDKVYFGTYPQTQITDKSLIKKLNKIAKKPTSSNSYNWTSYNYYISSEVTNYMFYQDVDYDNDGIYDYRGVYFNQYRPYYFSKESSAYNSHQDDSGYKINTVYWFSYDLIEWDILTESDGKALIIASLVLDSQEYYPSDLDNVFNHNGGYGYANNYELSEIRKFLNDDFYNTAFNDLQKGLIETTLVDNSISSPTKPSNDYVCNNTNDKIFLLSIEEVTTYYTSDNYQDTYGTDYAKSQGLWVHDRDKVSYWLRSPYYNNARGVYFVTYDMDFSYEYVHGTYFGVRPACQVDLSIIDGTQVIPNKEDSIDIDITNKPIIKKGNKFYFGRYPQKQVTDEELISELNTLAGKLPTSVKSYHWTSYDYYISSKVKRFMFYQDIDYDNDGIYDYRGVYFTKYRHFYCVYDSTIDNSYQYSNGYTINTIYWFSYDPIEWDILTVSKSNVLIIANMVLDSQEYNPDGNDNRFSHNGGYGYSNNYALSGIRKFLNDNFYNTAFNELEKGIIEVSIVNNSAASTGRIINKCSCVNTKDNIFILSKQEVKKYYVNIDDYASKGTDYAISQGLHTYKGDGVWWVRSPDNLFGNRVYAVNGFSTEGLHYVCSTCNGVRPVCWINLE